MPSPTAGTSQPAQTKTEPAEVSTGLVTVEVTDEGNTQTFEIEDVAAGTTVEDIMRSLTEIKVVIRGSGSTAFIEQIGETETSSTEGWVYRVDGEFADAGVGSTTVDPPTTISWTFGGLE